MPRGFILQPTYRMEAGRPVVLLYGKLESGRSFLIRDDRQQPHFYVLQRDAETAQRLGATLAGSTAPQYTLTGEPTRRVVLKKPQDTPPLRQRLSEAGVATFEADVRFAYRYLIDRGIRACLTIRGEALEDRFVDQVYHNPELEPADWTPRLSVLSLDIETDPAARRLLSIALVGCGAAEVLLCTPPGADCPPDARPFPTERALLQGFVRRVQQLDPDVLTGWNVIDFDLAVLLRLAEQLRVPLMLGRSPEPPRIRPATSRRASGQARISGRVVLDGIDLLRGAFVKLDSYSLGGASRTILGKGKTITGPDRAEEILRTFRQDRKRFVDYNLNDARLVIEILDRLHLVELAVERSRLTGMPPDRVAASIASFDFLYLSELHRRGIVAPSVRAGSSSAVESSGGHVLDPRPGLYRNVVVFDFKSLYPSVIRTFQIDPLGQLRQPSAADDPIIAPNGAAFRRQPGILPHLLDDLFPRREAAKAAGDPVASQAIKILMNSFYGVLGTSACRFASPALANAITGFGREVLLWTKRRIECDGYRVLYGDTDSLFVESGLDRPQAASELGTRLVAQLNSDLARHVRNTWRVDSRLELEFETLYLRLLLPSVRHGTAGARKRYAGLVDRDGERRVEFTGMEVVRRDWTRLAKRIQRELFRRLFADLPVDDYVRETVARLRAGHLDDLLVYRKGLRRELDSYTASTPPHVAAARKMSRPPRYFIEYLITTNGPEPAQERRSPIDHEHYVQKQVRPVAEPVLSLLHLDFDRVVGDDVQLRLF